MKKILVLFAATLLIQVAAFAQKPKEVSEKDVAVRIIKDFQSNAKGATGVKWYQIDSTTFRAVYTDSEGDPMAMQFNNKGFETHYIIRPEHYTAAIKDTVKNNYHGYTINEVYIRKVKGVYSYQVCIAKKKGILWWRKEADPKLLNFDTSGKFLGE